MKGTLNSVNHNEVLKYLGYKGGATDEKTINDIQRISEDVIKTAQPAVTYMVLMLKIISVFREQILFPAEMT